MNRILTNRKHGRRKNGRGFSGHRAGGKRLATAVAAVAVAGGTVFAAMPAGAETADRPERAPALGQVLGTQLIVGYKAGTAKAAALDRSSADQARAAVAGATFQRRTATGGAVVSLGTAATDAVDRALAGFRADPEVEYVEVDRMLTTQAEPDDPEYPKQWDLTEPQAGMNVPGAWDGGNLGKDAVVAVIDTGYVEHADLEPNIVPGYDMITKPEIARDNDGRDANAADEGDWVEADGACGPDSVKSNSSWHGTHVAGTIAAASGNGIGVAGIAPAAKVQPVRALGRCGGMSSDIADGIVWASGGEVPGLPKNPTPAKVINMSLGGAGACGIATQKAIDDATARGTSVVVAAGNVAKDAIGFNPANCNNVVAVAAGNRVGDKAFYSNFGALVDVTAPGGQTRGVDDAPGTITTPENGILSTVNTGITVPEAEAYRPMMGTSMAAPHVAGVVALMAGKDPAITPVAVEDLLKANVRPIPGVCAEGCGAGLVDTAKTVNAVGAPVG